MVHDKVWSDFYGHAGHRESVFPQPGVLEDVGQADEGNVLFSGGKNKDYLKQSFVQYQLLGCLTYLHVMGGVVEGLSQAVDGSLALTFHPPVQCSHAG